MKYVLITAARNESAFIEHTLRSVVAQTHRPERWVIVDDGSTDETPQIVERHVKQNPWIELVRRPQRADRSFAGKAHAVSAGLERVKDVQFEVMGNLDADVSFEPDYMAFVMGRFEGDPKLGVAGTPFTEVGGYDSTRDSFEGQNYVAGPCQLFRCTCWQDIGGYVANKAGGVDWIAVMTARMKGWTVSPFLRNAFIITARWAPPSAVNSPPAFPTVRRITTSVATPLAVVPVRLSDGKAPLHPGRAGVAVRLFLGGVAPDAAGGQSGVDAFPSRGADEKTQGRPALADANEEGGQLCAGH